MDDFIKSLDSLKSQLSNILTSIQEDTEKAFQEDDYTLIAPLTIEYKGIKASLPIDLSDQQTLQEIFMKYEDSWSCIRGDKNTSIDDANIDYWERG